MITNRATGGLDTMRKHARRFLSMLLGALLACYGAAAEGYALNAVELGLPSDSRWEIEYDVVMPDGFMAPLNEYRVHQARGSEMVDDMNRGLGGQISMQVGKLDKSHLFSGGTACMVPLGSVFGTPLSERQERLLDSCLACLEEAGWHSYGVPYACGTLQERYQNARAAVIGQLTGLDDYLRSAAPQDLTLVGDEQIVVLAAEMDGYPIVPDLFGDFADSDVPCYAAVLMNHDQVLYLDVGCGYVIDQRIPLQGEPIACVDAMHTALRHAYQQWRQAWSSMAEERSEVLDYPAFWRAYDPRFILRAVGARACYYAKDGILRPCWEINCQIEVLLSNDEELSPEERHRYVPERIDASYFVDAYRGELVW